MAVSIARIQSPLNFLLNQIFICYCRSQIFEFARFLKDLLAIFYVMTFPCNLVTRQQYIVTYLGAA
jgi:hypothetical protein